MRQPEEVRRHKIVQASTQVVLETIVQEMERQDWGRTREIALAKSTLDSQPPYWLQSMSHPGLSAKLADGHPL